MTRQAEIERLAIFLAVGHRTALLAANKVDLLNAWGELSEGRRRAYVARARRLLAAWGVT